MQDEKGSIVALSRRRPIKTRADGLHVRQSYATAFVGARGTV